MGGVNGGCDIVAWPSPLRRQDEAIDQPSHVSQGQLLIRSVSDWILQGDEGLCRGWIYNLRKCAVVHSGFTRSAGIGPAIPRVYEAPFPNQRS